MQTYHAFGEQWQSSSYRTYTFTGVVSLGVPSVRTQPL